MKSAVTTLVLLQSHCFVRLLVGSLDDSILLLVVPAARTILFQTGLKGLGFKHANVKANAEMNLRTVAALDQAALNDCSPPLWSLKEMEHRKEKACLQNYSMPWVVTGDMVVSKRCQPQRSTRRMWIHLNRTSARIRSKKGRTPYIWR